MSVPSGVGGPTVASVGVPVPAGARHAPKVLLVGMPGCGKSSVAPLLAPRLGWGYVDTDAQIERVSGLTVRGFFARHGEAAFRAQEARCLAWVLGLEEPVIVAVGGGAVVDPENRRMMKERGIVIWLRATVPTLVAHLKTGAGRPLLEDAPDLRTALAQLDAERRPLYQEVATVTIDVDDGDADKVADRVLRALGRVGRRTT
jgi:shikimate kinase